MYTESLDGYLPNLVGLNYLWPPHICIDFGPNPPRGGSEQGHNRSIMGPSPKDFFRVGRLQQQTESVAMVNDIKPFGKKCCNSFFFGPFWSIVFTCIGLCIGRSHFDLFSFKYFNGAKCLISINLCTFHVKKNSARLQWYSCARYKAPGALVYYVALYVLWHLSIFQPISGLHFVAPTYVQICIETWDWPI